jgi:hypothetical protein
MSWLLQCGLALGAVLVILIIALRLFAYFTLGVCRSTASMKGRTVIITGANSGLHIGRIKLKFILKKQCEL